MKKIFMAVAVCVCIAGLSIPGYCQDDGAIEQSESQMGESLSSEINEEGAQGTLEASEANEENSAGEMMTL